MRCSSRGHGTILPNATSTPTIGRTKRDFTKAFPFTGADLSPILENNIAEEPRQRTRRRVLSSDCGTRLREVAKSPRLTSEKILPQGNSTVGLQQISKKRCREQHKLQSCLLEELSTEGRRPARRTSRVDAILDEIVRESLRKSTLDIKVKSDESVDAIVEQAVKNRNSEMNHIVGKKQSNRARNNQKRVEKKENLVRKIISGCHEVDLLLVKNNNDPSYKKVNLRPSDSILKGNSGNKMASKGLKSAVSQKNIQSQVPEIFLPETLDWHEVNGQEGVSIFKMPSVTYLKIIPKCRLMCNGPFEHELYIIIEGHALATISHNKTKVGPGTCLRLSSGSEIMNTGITKNLILICVQN